jgi:hypothetical protein
LDLGNRRIEKFGKIIEKILMFNYTLENFFLPFENISIENILFRNKFLPRFVFLNFYSNFDLIFCFDLSFFNKRKFF